jgi:hypothetical protein
MDTLTEEEKQKVLETSAIVKLDLIVKIMKCIEIASAKGAYQPSDMTFVGNIYDALLKGINDAFKEEIKKKAAAAETAAAETTETAVTETAVAETAVESCKIVEEVSA